MQDIAWGAPSHGVRFGLRVPERAMVAGHTIVLELFCENQSYTPIFVFGFQPTYPRSLRLSPPRPERPFILVTFGDERTLHPPEAFLRVDPGTQASTSLDLSFAFDRRGEGDWPVAFRALPVAAMGGLRAWRPHDEAGGLTAVAELKVTRLASMRAAGIGADLESELDTRLLAGDPSLPERLRALGTGGADYAAQRVARVLVPGADATLGWKALDALEMIGPAGLDAVHEARHALPHAAEALTFAAEWLGFRLGHGHAARDLPFVTALEDLIAQPDRRGNFAVTWVPYDLAIHGRMSLDIARDAERIVHAQSPGGGPSVVRRARLKPMQVQALLDTLAHSGVWLLRPLRTMGIPDEPRPSLRVQLDLAGGSTRHIEMWNGEWRHGPGFRLAGLLDRIANDPD